LEGFEFQIETILNEPTAIVMRKVHKWVSKANYDDLCLIYFSGHGKLSRSRELYLTCSDSIDGFMNSTAVAYNWLTQLLRDNSLQRVAIILDCCYAGKALGARGAIEEQVRSAVGDDGSGIFFLGASGANQTAEERERDGHGRLTKQ